MTFSTREDGSAIKNYGVARGRDFVEVVKIHGIDLSSDTFTGAVRMYADASAILVSMTISAPVYSVTQDATIFDITIPRSTAYPVADEIGDSVELVYDIVREHNSKKETFLCGKFKVYGAKGPL